MQLFLIPVGFILLILGWPFSGMLVVNVADGLAFGFIVYSAYDCLQKLKICDMEYIEFSEHLLSEHFSNSSDSFAKELRRSDDDSEIESTQSTFYFKGCTKQADKEIVLASFHSEQDQRQSLSDRSSYKLQETRGRGLTMGSSSRFGTLVVRASTQMS